jgi:hypothetical protein
MPDTEAPVARLSRVTTRRGTLRQLNCPLEPELLVAEFSGELPPDVAVAVREHMAVCDICGARARELRMPYALLSSLGAAPAPFVPDLRENVRVKAARAERILRPLRAMGSLGRFGVFMAVLTLVAVVVVAFALGGLAQSFGLLTVARTTNQLQHVPAAAQHGALLAETDKLVTVTDSSGANWQVAEVIVTDQRTGQVTRSLPASSAALHQASATTLPLAVVMQGHTVYELTTRQNSSEQALVAFDMTSGATRFILRLTLPNGKALPSGESAVSLALSPDGSSAYVGLNGAAVSGLRALVVATGSGKMTSAISMTTPTSIPLPPPPGSLPPSAFPTVVPIVSISGMAQSEAAGGAITISPDGAALFDVTLASDASGVRYAVVRRFDLATGQVTALGLQGNFATARLAISATPSSPQLYLVTGSPNATVYVIDTFAQAPALEGQVALGGPAAPGNVSLNDNLSVSPAADGGQLYVAQDASSSDGLIVAHSRWLVDTHGMGVLASATDPTTAGSLLANTAPDGKTFALINGQIAIGSPELDSGWTPWLQTNDNLPITRLIATTP